MALLKTDMMNPPEKWSIHLIQYEQQVGTGVREGRGWVEPKEMEPLSGLLSQDKGCYLSFGDAGRLFLNDTWR